MEKSKKMKNNLLANYRNTVENVPRASKWQHQKHRHKSVNNTGLVKI